MVAIIDYDAGNLKSVEKAVLKLGGEPLITREPAQILAADHVILPGVGAFGDAMARLGEYGLPEVISQVIGQGVPFLGICLGLQLLFSSSEESPGVAGLGILPGRILRIPAQGNLKIPHMGWNDLTVKPGASLFAGLPAHPYVYFVHSYYLMAQREEDVAAVTRYGVTIHAAVERGNIFACQFHPEKSGETGLRILDNFLRVKF